MSIKAAMLTPNLSMGGAERWIVSLVRYSDPARIEWTGVAASGHGGADVELCKELADHVPLHCNPPKCHRPFAVEYFQEHANMREAVAHICRDADVLVTWGATKIDQLIPELEIPVVLVSHSTEPTKTKVLGPTHLAGVSEKSLEQFPNTGLPKEVVWNGADARRVQLKHGRRWQRKQWGVWPWDVVIGYLGRHSKEKRPEAAIHALAELPFWYKAVYYGWSIADDHKPDPKLVKLAEEVAPGRIKFYSPQTFIGDILAGIDVFMLASHREAFSLGLAEAWLAGKPVVATPVGSVPEIERLYGSLTVPVPVGASAKELADAVTAATTPEMHVRAESAQLLAKQEWTCEAMADRWATYLERVVRDSQSREKVGLPDASEDGKHDSHTPPNEGIIRR